MRGGIVAAVAERDFLLGHKAVLEDREQNGGERSVEHTIGVLYNHFHEKVSYPHGS